MSHLNHNSLWLVLQCVTVWSHFLMTRTLLVFLSFVDTQHLISVVMKNGDKFILDLEEAGDCIGNGELAAHNLNSRMNTPSSYDSVSSWAIECRQSLRFCFQADSRLYPYMNQLLSRAGSTACSFQQILSDLMYKYTIVWLVQRQPCCSEHLLPDICHWNCCWPMQSPLPWSQHLYYWQRTVLSPPSNFHVLAN